jgi:LysR family glycine cleavage system transcriptional activator
MSSPPARLLALVPHFFVRIQLEQLGLVIPVDAPLAPDSAYYLVYPTDMGNSSPLEQFRGWLIERAQEFAGRPA